MNRSSWRSVVKAVITFAILTGLLFLLVVPHHHAVDLSYVLFIPVFFAGLVEIPAAPLRLVEADALVPNSVFKSFRRFQRPPPLALA